MITLPVLIYGLIAYLLGSIPSAVWYGKWMYGIDVREHGSKNAGATNTLRVLGNKPGVIVLCLDLLKGSAAVSLVALFEADATDMQVKQVHQMAYGALAVLGHVYPVFASFRGGKGIATLLGITIAISPLLALISALIFIAVVFITRYISLGSMSAAVVSPLIAFFLYGQNVTPLFYYCCVVGALVLYTHRTNIQRLLSGTENKFAFKKSVTTS